jgi:hypothetical protein
VLGFIILFGGCFWLAFVDTNITHTGVGVFFKDILFFYSAYLYILAHGYLL